MYVTAIHSMQFKLLSIRTTTNSVSFSGISSALTRSGWKIETLVMSTENFKAYSHLFIYLCKEELHKKKPTAPSLEESFQSLAGVHTLAVRLSET